MRDLARVAGSVLFLAAAGSSLGLLGGGLFAWIGWAEPVVAVTSTWSYHPAEQPWLHALFGAVNVGGFICLFVGTLGAAFAALRSGALGLIVGGGLVAFSAVLSALALANPIDLDGGQRGLFCGASTVFTLFGVMMVRAWWRMPPPPVVRPA